MTAINPGARSEWPSSGVAWGWVAVLLAGYGSSFADRQILSLLVDEIRADLVITDTQFGLLQGLSFAMLYSLAGLPFGDLVDRTSRRGIVAGGMFAWSVMTTFCGLAVNYWQLFLSRMGVGVGEATLSPAAYSILADAFPPKRLPRALSVYKVGAGIGAGLALIASGQIIDLIAQSGPVVLPFLGEIASWQVVFIALGLPGVALALVTIMMPEPQRHGATKAAPPWSAVLKFYAGTSRFTLPFLLACVCASITTVGTMSWGPAIFLRVYEQGTGQVGLAFGCLIIVAVTGGLMSGAWLTERFTEQGKPDAPIRACMFGAMAAVPAAIAVVLVHNSTWAFVAMAFLLYFANFPFGVSAATLQVITPNEMRGRGSALFLLCTGGSGAAFGPLIPGLLSDNFFGTGYNFGYAVVLPAIVLSAISATLMAFVRPRYVALMAAKASASK